MIEVELTIAETMMGAQTGVNRQVAAIKHGLIDAGGYDGLGWSLHIEGACGELAVAKAFSIFWSASVNTFKTESDIGYNLEVRTRLDHNHDLIVRDRDNLENIFILVTGQAPKFQIHGWIKGIDAKKDKWWKDYGNRNGAWFVPKKNLNAISLLNARWSEKQVAAA